MRSGFLVGTISVETEREVAIVAEKPVILTVPMIEYPAVKLNAPMPSYGFSLDVAVSLDVIKGQELRPLLPTAGAGSAVLLQDSQPDLVPIAPLRGTVDLRMLLGPSLGDGVSGPRMGVGPFPVVAGLAKSLAVVGTVWMAGGQPFPHQRQYACRKEPSQWLSSPARVDSAPAVRKGGSKPSWYRGKADGLTPREGSKARTRSPVETERRAPRKGMMRQSEPGV